MRLFVGIVLSFSLLWALGHHRPAESPPASFAAVPQVPPEARVVADAIPPTNPFAYVREDGSLQYVPAKGEGAYLDPPSQAGLEDIHAGSGFLEPMSVDTAVYSWSTAEPAISP